MWDKTEGKFWTGTKGERPLLVNDINTEVIPVDVQAWALMALGSGGRGFAPALDYVATKLGAESGGGFSFSNADRSGTWYEGTGQMAVAYRLTDPVTDSRKAESQRLVRAILAAATPSGTIVAANKELFTGFYVMKDVKWMYYRRGHTGATAWAVFAERGINPFAAVSPR
jgi:hypothetical protein